MLIIPEEIINLDEGGVFESPRNKLKKVMRESIVPILVIILFIGITSFTISRYKLPSNNSKNNFFQNEIINLFKLSKVEIQSPPSSTRILEEILKKDDGNQFDLSNFITNINTNSYSGEWESSNNSLFPEMSNGGSLFLQFSSNRNIEPDNFSVAVRLSKGRYIDQWQSLYNEILINNIVVKNDSNHLYLNGNFGARAETGELFDKTSSNGSKLFFI